MGGEEASDIYNNQNFTLNPIISFLSFLFVLLNKSYINYNMMHGLRNTGIKYVSLT